MFNWLAKKWIAKLGEKYQYDVSYMDYLLAKSPAAFRKFSSAAALSSFRQQVPVEAALTVQLVATMEEDCGTCTQLVAQFAEEASMAADQIAAVLTHDYAVMTETVSLAYRYAISVLPNAGRAARSMGIDVAQNEAREAIRTYWGDPGLIDLALAMQGVRLYPMVKKALGFANSCQQVSVGERLINLSQAA